MKASDATKLAGAQLKPDSKLIQPFLQPVFEKVKEAAERGNFSVEVRWPYRHEARTPVQWSDSIKDGVEAALRELGYTVSFRSRSHQPGSLTALDAAKALGGGGHRHAAGAKMGLRDWAPFLRGEVHVRL